MPISVKCRNCDASLRVRDEAAGKTLPCPKCQSKVKIPAPKLEESIDEFEELEELPVPVRRRPKPEPVQQKPAKKKKKRKSSDGGTALWAQIGGGIISFLFIAGLIVRVGVRAGLLADRNPRPVAQPVAQGGMTPMMPPGAAPVAGGGGVSSSDSLTAQIATTPLPQFPDLGPGQPVGAKGVTVQTLSFSPPANAPSAPGGRMKVRVYLPAGTPQPMSLTAVLVAPAGTNLIIGNSLDTDDYHSETLPYAEAGLVAVMYELDGGVPNAQQATDQQLARGYQVFRAASGGVINSRNAFEFVLAKIPAVNPQRIFSAGHSSAGTEALIFAAHEPRLKGCIAYAPCGNVEQNFAQEFRNPAVQQLLPGLQEFTRWSSPIRNADQVKCPVFLFNAKDDTNTTYAAAQELARAFQQHNPHTTMVSCERGGHYDSMIAEGIPAAIPWMQAQP